MHAALVKTQLRGLLKWKGSWENTFPYNFKGILVLLLGFVTLATRVTIESVQFSRSVVSDFLRPHGWQHARPPCSSPAPRAFLNSCPSTSNHLILCHPLLLLPSIFTSIRVFSSDLVLHLRWPKYWSFSIHPSNEYSGLISFRIDWLDLLAVQGILNSLLQHHSSKASILWCSAFFTVQLSYPYMTTGKTIEP